MGNKVSKDSKNYCLRIDIENSTFIAGEELTGVINLFIFHPIRPDPLYLKFIGKEISSLPGSFTKKASKFLLNSSNNTSATNTSQDLNKKEKITIRKLIYQASVFEDVLGKGIYCFPFKFIIPPELPGTLIYKKGAIDSSISYHLKAFIIENEQKVYSKTPVIIRQDPVDSRNRKKEEPVTHFLGFCRIVSGECRLSIKLTDETYSSFSDSSFLLEVDNRKSSIFITKIEVSLYYFISFCEGNGVTLVENDKIFTYCQVAEIRPGEIRTKENSVKVDLKLSRYQKYLKERPSVKGIHAETVYYLVVKARGSSSLTCFNRYPQCMDYIRISPVVELEKVTSSKPVYGDGYFYDTVELKEYNRDFIETED